MRIGRRTPAPMPVEPVTPLAVAQLHVEKLFPTPYPTCTDRGEYYIYNNGLWTHTLCFDEQRSSVSPQRIHPRENYRCPVTTYYLTGWDMDASFTVEPGKPATYSDSVTVRSTVFTLTTDNLTTLTTVRELRSYAEEAVKLIPTLTSTEQGETAHLITSLATAVHILTLQRPLALAPLHAGTPVYQDYLTNSLTVEKGLDALKLLITGQRVQHAIQQSGAGDIGLLMGNLAISTEIATAIAEVRQQLEASSLALPV